MIINNDTCHVFIGETNSDGLPCGMVQLYKEDGDCCEGSLTPDCKKNGFCVTFKGKQKQIDIGWYSQDVVHGNHMTVDASDMTVISQGWYEYG